MRALAALTLLAALTAAPAHAARFGPDDRETLLLSRTPAGGFPNGASRNATIAGDYQLASLAAYDSDASDIVAGDSNGASDVFLVRRRRPFSIDGEPWRAGRTTLVSRPRSGGPANGPSYRPDLAGDRHHRPRCIAFVSRASNLVSGDRDHTADALVQDLRTRRTRLVSAHVRAEVTEVRVDGSCTRFAFVARGQVYVRARGHTRRVSSTRSGRPGNGASSQVSLSRTGGAIAYTSTATNLARGDRNARPDVYLKLPGHPTRIVSRGGNGASDQPDVVAGGRAVAFRTEASDLLAGDTNNVADIALAMKGRLLFASRSEALGQNGNRPSAEPSVTEPGTNVFFSSFASNLQSTTRGTLFDRNGAGDVFFWSELSRNVSLQSRDSHNEILNNGPGHCCSSDQEPHVAQAPAEHPAVSLYGNYVLFESPYPLIDLRAAADRFPGLSPKDAAVMSNERPELRQVYLRYIGPR